VQWDRIFDASKIIGTLPPIAGEDVRAPAAHFGEVLFCWKSTNISAWKVFYGFVDPVSPKFDRQNRTCTFTVYAPGKLLEAGNAERVHRFNVQQLGAAGVAARPFVLPVDLTTGKGAVQHPTVPGGTIQPTEITTTLSGNINGSVTSLVVASVKNFPQAPFLIQIDSEYIEVDVSAGTTFSNVSRGQLNSAAVSHTAGAIVTLIASGPDNSWWRLWKGNTSPALPLQAGDEFQVVRAIPAGSWVEGMQTVQIVNKTFTIAQ